MTRLESLIVVNANVKDRDELVTFKTSIRTYLYRLHKLGFVLNLPVDDDPLSIESSLVYLQNVHSLKWFYDIQCLVLPFLRYVELNFEQNPYTYDTLCYRTHSTPISHRSILLKQIRINALFLECLTISWNDILLLESDLPWSSLDQLNILLTVTKQDIPSDSLIGCVITSSTFPQLRYLSFEVMAQRILSWFDTLMLSLSTLSIFYVNRRCSYHRSNPQSSIDTLMTLIKQHVRLNDSSTHINICNVEPGEALSDKDRLATKGVFTCVAILVFLQDYALFMVHVDSQIFDANGKEPLKVYEYSINIANITQSTWITDVTIVCDKTLTPSVIAICQYFGKESEMNADRTFTPTIIYLIDSLDYQQQEPHSFICSNHRDPSQFTIDIINNIKIEEKKLSNKEIFEKLMNTVVNILLPQIED
ncbi:hypothetical protein I4U23_011731 [Adineta vaga]|nr:hypothetical protein I4U23_011731 [Adineta vaga]